MNSAEKSGTSTSAMTYSLLDSGGQRKLERIGNYTLIRPAAQAVWEPRRREAWSKADAEFVRHSGGDGQWKFTKPYPKGPDLAGGPPTQVIPVALGPLSFRLRPTDFGHLGIFAEQQDNWRVLKEVIRQDQQVLNLFAYTGGSTLAAAEAGAKVVHLDASKTSVAWARENAVASGLGETPIRWIVDDVQKFVQREVRRESRYHGIILDPPSYGRGPKGQTWKIEEHLVPLLKDLKQILADDFSFLMLSAHSPGHTPLALENLIRDMGLPKGKIDSREMVIREEGGGRSLPSGATAFFQRT